MSDTVVSNCVGPGGTPIDRLYGNLNGSLRLVQKDFSVYKGGITKKALTKKGLDGNNFRSYCYVTDDNRWFDRAGMPIDKPKSVVENE